MFLIVGGSHLLRQRYESELCEYIDPRHERLGIITRCTCRADLTSPKKVVDYVSVDWSAGDGWKLKEVTCKDDTEAPKRSKVRSSYKAQSAVNMAQDCCCDHGHFINYQNLALDEAVH